LKSAKGRALNVNRIVFMLLSLDFSVLKNF
jgi:hypothetical protein